MPIQWDKSHSVNVKEIDEQHKHFIGILNKMYELIYKKASQDELKVILDELIAFTDVHFDTEEKYFDQFKYENSSVHKAAHRKLKTQVEDFYKKLEAGETEIPVELMDFLEDWLVDHLDIQDKKYTKCFNEHGLY